MCHSLFIESLLEALEQLVELLRLYDWPWNNVELPAVKTCDEICLLFVLNDLLKLEREPSSGGSGSCSL